MGGTRGGNDITAEFRHPGVADSPLSVSMTGNDLVVSLATDAAGALTSTAAQVISAINATPAANALLVALTYRGNAGAGIVQPRLKVNLSDFLTTSANAHVRRGPFESSVMRIGKDRRVKVGVFLTASSTHASGRRRAHRNAAHTMAPFWRNTGARSRCRTG